MQNNSADSLRRVRAVLTTLTTETLSTELKGSGAFEGGDRYPRLTPTHRPPMGADGRGWARKAVRHGSCFPRRLHTKR